LKVICVRYLASLKPGNWNCDAGLIRGDRPFGNECDGYDLQLPLRQYCSQGSRKDLQISVIDLDSSGEQAAAYLTEHPENFPAI